MTALTTHVLDTSLGVPAAGIKISLYKLIGNEQKLLKETVTNHDGRTDEPLLSDQEMTAGHFQLVFEMGDYFKTSHNDLADPLFIDSIPIRFGISDAASHYHVPLLVSPFGYSTYRGS